MAYKVFSNGSVLNASEINDNLMNQSVMVFSNSTARAAALTAPIEGMLTWLEDVNRYEFRNGSGAWVALGSGALELIKTQTIGTTVTDVTVSDAFTTDYDAYKITVTGGTSSAEHPMRMQLGTATNGHNWHVFFTTWGAGSPGGTGASNAAFFGLVGNSSPNGLSLNVDVLDPFAAKTTRLFGAGSITSGLMSTNMSLHTSTTSFTSFRLFPEAGNMTGGIIRVYGYKKA